MKENVKLDLLGFSKNPTFTKIVHDKGVSLSSSKTILSLVCLVLSFGFLLNKCFNPEVFTYHYAKDYTLLLLLILVINLYAFTRFTIPIVNYYRSKKWIKVTAKIIELGIFQLKSPIAYSFSQATSYFPAIIYTYEVSKQSYNGRSLSFVSDYVHNDEIDENSSSQYHEMNALFLKWMTENKVHIFYNPRKPKQSVVFRDFNLKLKIFYGILGTLAMISLLVSVYNFLCYMYLS